MSEKVKIGIVLLVVVVAGLPLAAICWPDNYRRHA